MLNLRVVEVVTRVVSETIIEGPGNRHPGTVCGNFHYCGLMTGGFRNHIANLELALVVLIGHRLQILPVVSGNLPGIDAKVHLVVAPNRCFVCNPIRNGW